MLHFFLENWGTVTAVVIGGWELFGRLIPTTKPIVPSTNLVAALQKGLAMLYEVLKMADNLTAKKLK